MKIFNLIFNFIFNIIFPSNCLSCGKPDEDLCANCMINLPASERETESWIFSVFDYQDEVIRRAILSLKYKNKRRLANAFARAMLDRILEEISELKIMKNFNNPILIPIPLSGERYRERGFNQSEIICKELIKLLSNYNKKEKFLFGKNILIKTIHTIPQVKVQDRNKRLKNIIGSFKIKNKKNKELIKNRNIILIDDVTTTGATLKEAKKTLKKAGAKTIIAITIAH